MFRDEIVVTLRAGRGGPGCIAFHREKYVPKGGPSGGDGGRGGDVVLIAAEDVHGFFELRGRRLLGARNGEPGRGTHRHGKKAPTLEVRVPVGTEVRDAATDVLLKDLVTAGDSVRVVRGGRGGRGNARFARSTRQTPRHAEPGEDGGERRVQLSLKMIADVGLVGLPNAGKSTFLARVSGSRTRSAGYRFTTLGPHLGVVELDAGRRLTVTDLPGLIEGAHEGRGLGDRFLKHVERTRVLVHVVAHDPLEGPEAAARAYATIRGELAAYSDALASKPELVVLAKCDLTGWEESRDVLEQACGNAPLPLSSLSGLGVETLLVRIARMALDEDDGEPRR